MSRKENLIQQFRETRLTTSQLCSPLKDEDFVAQPIEDVSPPKWHLGHTAWFFERFILEKFKSAYQPYNPHYNYLFNSYYETAGKRVVRADRGNLTRPTTAEIVVYREYVDNELLEMLEGMPKVKSEILELLELGIHHEQQHQELLMTDIKYILGHNPLYPAYFQDTRSELSEKPARPLSFLEMDEGIYEIGHAGNGFAYDNELARHKVFLEDFCIMDRLVTVGEYLEFIESGGYASWEHWLSEGWTWLNQNGVSAPLYWQKEGKEWFYYTLAGYRNLDLNAPVSHISYYEAEAFASWKGKRLPTESEWESTLMKYCPDIEEGSNFLESGFFMPQPAGDNKQLYGDVWEWTGSAYLPYPNYKKPPGAIGEYNGKFMIGQMVLRGGSCVTPLSHIRPEYRNFFQPDKRWQFKGFRLAE